MMQQESITYVGKSGKALRQDAVSCIDNKPIYAELEALHVAVGDFLVWLFAHETSTSVELTRMTLRATILLLNRRKSHRKILL